MSDPRLNVAEFRQEVGYFAAACDNLIIRWRSEVSAELHDYAAMMALASLVNGETSEKRAANEQREHQGYAMAYDGSEDPSDAEVALRKMLIDSGRLPKPEPKPDPEICQHDDVKDPTEKNPLQTKCSKCGETWPF